jgi:hypothetical protein
MGTARDLHEQSLRPLSLEQTPVTNTGASACRQNQVDHTSSIDLFVALAIARDVRGILSSGILNGKGR